MSTPSDAAGRPVSKRHGKSRSLQQLVRRAPGPEQPDVRDKAGAQRGMAILLIAGGAFWLAVAAVAFKLLG